MITRCFTFELFSSLPMFSSLSLGSTLMLHGYHGRRTFSNIIHTCDIKCTTFSQRSQGFINMLMATYIYYIYIYIYIYDNYRANNREKNTVQPDPDIRALLSASLVILVSNNCESMSIVPLWSHLMFSALPKPLPSLNNLQDMFTRMIK